MDRETLTTELLKDEYAQAIIRGGTAYAEAYIEGLQDGAKNYESA